MVDVRLVRIKATDTGTLGTLTLNGKELCKTLELPWKDNADMISCIPVGTYECKPWDSAKFPNVWEITNVPNREAILIHSGNTMKDTHGCVLVGQGYGSFNGMSGVVNSRKALENLRGTLPHNFTLTVSQAWT